MEPTIKGEAKKKDEAYLYHSKPTSWGSLISLLLVITIIIIGALYAWGKRIDTGATANNHLPTFKVQTQVP